MDTLANMQTLLEVVQQLLILPNSWQQPRVRAGFFALIQCSDSAAGFEVQRLQEY